MKMIVIVVAMLLVHVSYCFAGGISLYAKTGFLDWKEHVDGKRFMSETGAIQEFGVNKSTSVDGVEFYQSLGVWFGELSYDGVRLEDKTPLKTISGDVGFKGKVGLNVPVLLTDNLGISALTGIDTNVFVRFVPGEIWTVVTAKTGLGLVYKNYEIKAGVLYPVFTSDTVSLSNFGVKDWETTHPKGMISPFAELTAKLDDQWTVGAYFEVWRWSQSNPVPYRYVGANPGSALAKDNVLYQPDTTVINSGINLNCRF